ncbi:hypothetical protein I302_101771 [Kwoniella bestiolae CBS 10118]|uniref:Uncharacterized protein n=1 Tax=Kwoniella bestiolae CBS 10118 TaxID=1296100 RepID=A0A1B9GD62_9TREE|nr:hypothetical protein I302_00451 [Kwoniella bestiolae CBS 10118]OCF28960.1 hypothetical protein I302_00451 [Kwoniella bestiolae CBS 10118]
MLCIAFFLSLMCVPYLAWLHWKVTNIFVPHLALYKVERRVHLLEMMGGAAVDEPLITNVQDDKIRVDLGTFETPRLAEPTSHDASAIGDMGAKGYSKAARRLYNLASDNQDTFQLHNKVAWDTFTQALNISIVAQRPEAGRRLLRSLSPIDKYGLSHSFDLAIYIRAG